MACKCIECWGDENPAPHGPLTAAQERRIEQALVRAGYPQPHPLPLRQVTDEQVTSTAPVCDGDPMTCDCPRHRGEVAVLIHHGPKRVRQPWDVKAA